MPRTVADIDADTAAIKRKLGRLADERVAAVAARNQAIVHDFDAGRTVKQIAFDHATSENIIYPVLRKAGRRFRAPIKALTAEQRRAYRRARYGRHLGPDAARRLAQAVAP